MKKILVVTGPSGVGKTFLAKLLLKKYPGQFREAKLFTTRQPRKGEVGTDRIFITRAEFDKKKQLGDFAVVGMFHDNFYGYTKESFSPTDSHVIINTWPAMLPNFLTINNSIVLGLSISPEQRSLLEKRMQMRGDSEEKIRERIPLIQKDLKDLEAQQQNLRPQDKIFVIADDSTLVKEIIPWIEKSLRLN